MEESEGAQPASGTAVDASAAALALAYAGKPAEAKAQFARAAALDLTPSEKSEIATLRY